MPHHACDPATLPEPSHGVLQGRAVPRALLELWHCSEGEQGDLGTPHQPTALL